MEIINEILVDYEKYCREKIIEETGDNEDLKNKDSIYLYQVLKCRIIEKKPRKVLKAKHLIIPDEYLFAYQEIIQNIVKGTCLKKYQSRKINHLDSNDNMLLHWGIHHFHLGNSIEEDGFVERTKNLLFVFFHENKACVLGFFSHSSWCKPDLIQIIHDNWPSKLTSFKLQSNTPSHTENQYKALRKRNCKSTVIVSDGTEYCYPGVGVMSTGDPIPATIKYDKLMDMFDRKFECIKKNIDRILQSDPKSRKNDTLTIGMEINHGNKKIIYRIKETGSKFTLNKLPNDR